MPDLSLALERLPPVCPCLPLLPHSLFSLLVAFQTTTSESIKKKHKIPNWLEFSTFKNMTYCYYS